MWTYKDQPVESPPEGAYGFVYEIKNLKTLRKYIGRKYLTSASTKQKKGKVKKIRVESDWKNYWSSSPELLQEIADHGTSHLERTILAWGFSRAECNYLELKFQFDLRVLESDAYYNSNIAAKHFKRIVRKFPSSLDGATSQLPRMFDSKYQDQKV